MRMQPAVAQQAAFPDVNRTSLILFGGLVLIALNYITVNVGAIRAIFVKGAAPAQPAYGYIDYGWQLLGLGLLTLLAEYGGDAAGSASLLFLAALWLLWLVVHFGGNPVTAPAKESTTTQPKE